ncbi:hypothetical protein LXL04_005358 [Taraxacum kok-saghyz]
MAATGRTMAGIEMFTGRDYRFNGRNNGRKSRALVVVVCVGRKRGALLCARKEAGRRRAEPPARTVEADPMEKGSCKARRWMWSKVVVDGEADRRKKREIGDFSNQAFLVQVQAFRSVLKFQESKDQALEAFNFVSMLLKMVIGTKGFEFLSCPVRGRTNGLRGRTVGQYAQKLGLSVKVKEHRSIEGVELKNYAMLLPDEYYDLIPRISKSWDVYSRWCARLAAKDRVEAIEARGGEPRNDLESWLCDISNGESKEPCREDGLIVRVPYREVLRKYDRLSMKNFVSRLASSGYYGAIDYSHEMRIRRNITKKSRSIRFTLIVPKRLEIERTLLIAMDEIGNGEHMGKEELTIPLKELKVDEKKRLIEEPEAILECKTKKLRNKEIDLVLVRWKHSLGPNLTWETKDEMMKRKKREIGDFSNQAFLVQVQAFRSVLKFQESKDQALEAIADTRLYSDHKPIILKHALRNYGNTPFKFFNSWLEEEDLEEIIERTWKEFTIEGSHLQWYVLMQKLKASKEAIKKWSCEKKRKTMEDKSNWIAKLDDIDKQIEDGQNSANLIQERMVLSAKLMQLEKTEAEDIAQKNKNRWCLEGDENSALFHRNINKKKHTSAIKGVDINGTWETDPHKVKNCFKKHFEDTFKEDRESDWEQDLGNTTRIPTEISPDLEKPFEEKEIKEALWSCGANKSPGPDGFTVEFLKHHWELVKDDLISAFNEFAKHPKIPKGANEAFITLIPKIPNPSTVRDFRPISLISSVYKVLSKTLANRIKKVLPLIIDKTQSAFVKKRQILDGPLIASEVIEWAKSKNEKMFIFKSDIAKAYDSVSWRYLDSMMLQKCFGPIWRAWIKECLRSGRSSVLVNGSPTEVFSLQRGLRQGDPIAPFLFTLVMEGLNSSITRAVGNQAYQGIRVGKDEVPLTHLFFADDSIFFGKWSVENVLNLVRILHCFQRTSGLKVNLEKSALFGIGVDTNMIQNMALIIGCKSESFPTTFLGQLIGLNMGVSRSWKPIIDKIRKKLSTWKLKTLSCGGRHTIVNNILGTMGNYVFSLHRAPQCVIKEIEGIRREFFWGGDKENRRIPWVKWDSVMTNVEQGGLGIGSLNDINKALLSKWYWRYRTEEGALWVQILNSIHGKIDKWGPDGKITGGQTWKRIVKTWDQLKEEGLDPRETIQKRVGNGNSTAFWTDWWTNEKPLYQIYPRIYNRDQRKDVSVADRLDSIEQWKDSIRDGRSKDELEELLKNVSNFTLGDKPDTWICPGGPKGLFTVAWMKGKIAKNSQREIGKNRWNKWIPKRSNIFIWRVNRGRIATKKNLQDMGINKGAVICEVCNSGEENEFHSLRSCPIAKEVWDKVWSWWDLQDPNANSIPELLDWIEQQGQNPIEKQAMRVIGAATLSLLWQNRNEVTFLKKGKKAGEIFIQIQKEALLWISSRAAKVVIDSRPWPSSSENGEVFTPVACNVIIMQDLTWPYFHERLLANKGVVFIHSFLCHICDSAPAEANHMFLHCVVAIYMLQLIVRRWVVVFSSMFDPEPKPSSSLCYAKHYITGSWRFLVKYIVYLQSPRFLVCSGFLEAVPAASVTALAREISDHCPVLLSTDSVDFGSIPFRFFNSWLKREGLLNLVASTWLHFQGFGTADCYLAAKLRHLKGKIKHWRAISHPEENTELTKLKLRADSLDTAAETRSLSSEEITEWRDSFTRITEMEKIISLDLKQKSRIKWAINGDENTRFFHSEKAPGPNGFTFQFFKEYWDILLGDIAAFVKYFERFGKIDPSCSASFISLIPKIKDPIIFNDFRPISLIGSLYKIIAKILSSRLKKVIGSSIDEVQSAYVDGRNILDGPLTVNEICAWAKKTKKKILLFKADFDKAFDSVNWSFLDSTMQQMGYGDKWRMWIRGCLDSAKASILINGTPTKQFGMNKGVRQGDPLSPYLFIIAMEGLRIAMHTACSKGIFHGLQLPNNGPMISHLLYADDALFIGEWSQSNIENLAKILRCFHVSSGLKVSFNKSRVFGIGSSMAESTNWARPLGCEPSSLPFTYLGVSAGANMNLKKNWKPVIDRFLSKLTMWKSNSLSFGGRLTLISSVLGNLPTFYVSLFVAPSGVIDTMEKLRRNFQWGGSEGKSKINWVDRS